VDRETAANLVYARPKNMGSPAQPCSDGLFGGDASKARRPRKHEDESARYDAQRNTWALHLSVASTSAQLDNGGIFHGCESRFTALIVLHIQNWSHASTGERL
jgi:hypothetical protein